MHDLGRDIAQALRLAGRSPQYSAIVVLTLAIGIGGNAAAFTLIDAALFRPLPFERSDRLVQVWNWMSQPAPRNMTIAPADFIDIKERSRTLADMAAHNVWFATVGDASGAERVTAAVATANLFALLGVRPILGRNFRSGEDASLGDRVLILSHGAWLRRFGGSPTAVGSTLRVMGMPYEVIGVLPPDYRHPDPHDPLRDAEFFAPISYPPAEAARNSQFLRVIARMRDGVTVEQVQAELAQITSQLATEYPETNRDRGIQVLGLREEFFGKLSRPLLLAQGGAMLVLLIALANIGNLVLVRGHSRRREFAIRASLGARQYRLARQLIVETSVLSFIGSLLAIACLFAGIGSLRALEGRFLPIIANVDVDLRVIGFVFVLALMSGIAFGLVPLLELHKDGLRRVLAEDTAGAGRTRRAQRIQHTLVAAEVALALGLVVGTGVLARSLMALQRVSPGFITDSLLTFEVILPSARYPDTAQTATFFRQLEPKLAALPAVESAALISDLPLTSENRSLDMRPAGTDPARQTQIDVQVVTPSYFATIGIPLMSGRLFNDNDGKGAVLVSESLARLFWPSESAVGKAVDTERGDHVIVAGVVGDVVDQSLTSGTKPIMYLPLSAMRQRRLTAVLRTAGPPLNLVNAARNVVRGMDATAPVVEMRTMRSIVDAHLGQPRFTASLSSAFSILALALAALGVYGVLAYAVSTRTREIGIRAALGADPSTVGAMIVRQALVLVLPGIIAGALLGIAITRLLSRFLFGVRPLDAISFVAGAALLTAAAILAAWLPARRAARISPMQALLQP